MTNLLRNVKKKWEDTCDDKSWKLICRMLLLPKFPKKLSSSAYLTCSSLQELYAKLNKMASVAADIFVGRERFSTLLMMRLTETVMLWLSDDQTFWEEIEDGPRALGPLGLQQVISFLTSRVCFFSISVCKTSQTFAWQLTFPFTLPSFSVLPGYAICHPFWARAFLISACASSHIGHHW